MFLILFLGMLVSLVLAAMKLKLRRKISWFKVLLPVLVSLLLALALIGLLLAFPDTPQGAV